MATYLLLTQPDMVTNFIPIKTIPAQQKIAKTKVAIVDEYKRLLPVLSLSDIS